MMLGKDVALEKARRSIELAIRAGASEAFALLKSSDESLTRYSNNAIENSTHEYVPSLYLRVTANDRTAAVSSEDLTDESLLWLSHFAVESAGQSAPAGKNRPLAPAGQQYRDADLYDAQTAEMTAEERAHLIRRACERIGGRTTVRVYGNAVSGLEERAIANSNGVMAYMCGSIARMQVTALADTRGAGMVRHLGRSMNGVSPEQIADQAIYKAAHYAEFSDAPIGDYEVILEPSAAGEVLHHLSYLGFGGLGHLRGNSCFAGQMGQIVLSPEVTILDDPLRKDTLGSPFDWEGVATSPLTLVNAGRLESCVYDLEGALLADTRSTGHGQPPEGSWFSEGAYPTNLMLKPGTKSREQLISNVEHGLLVTAFHYTRPLDQRRAIITGMTRNGTFLIKDGKISAMLPNLRFAVSAVTLMQNVKEIGNDLTLAGDYCPHLTPSIRTSGFTVTGKTG